MIKLKKSQPYILLFLERPIEQEDFNNLVASVSGGAEFSGSTMDLAVMLQTVHKTPEFARALKLSDEIALAKKEKTKPS